MSHGIRSSNLFNLTLSNILPETSTSFLIAGTLTTLITLGTCYIITESYNFFINLEFQNQGMGEENNPNKKNKNDDEKKIPDTTLLNNILNDTLLNQNKITKEKKDVKDFINNNFLENIFILEDFQICDNITTILSNESFYNLLKIVYDNKNNKIITIQKSFEEIIGNEIEIFLDYLNECKSFKDFLLLEKNPRTILYLIKTIKYIYNL